MTIYQCIKGRWKKVVPYCDSVEIFESRVIAVAEGKRILAINFEDFDYFRIEKTVEEVF